MEQKLACYGVQNLTGNNKSNKRVLVECGFLRAGAQYCMSTPLDLDLIIGLIETVSVQATLAPNMSCFPTIQSWRPKTKHATQRMAVIGRVGVWTPVLLRFGPAWSCANPKHLGHGLQASLQSQETVSVPCSMAPLGSGAANASRTQGQSRRKAVSHSWRG